MCAGKGSFDGPVCLWCDADLVALKRACGVPCRLAMFVKEQRSAIGTPGIFQALAFFHLQLELFIAATGDYDLVGVTPGF